MPLPKFRDLGTFSFLSPWLWYRRVSSGHVRILFLAWVSTTSSDGEQKHRRRRAYISVPISREPNKSYIKLQVLYKITDWRS